MSYASLTSIQDNLKTLLEAEATPPGDPTWVPIFHGGLVPVITQEKGNITKAVQGALQKVGAGVIIFVPAITFPNNLTHQILLALRIAIGVTTNPIILAQRLDFPFHAIDIVTRIIYLVHGKPNGVSPKNHVRKSLFTIDREAAQMDTAGVPAGLDNYIVNVNTEIHL